MIRTAVSLCALILIAACVTSPMQGAPQPPPPPPLLATCSDGSSILTRVQVLDPSYSSSSWSPGKNSTPPPITSGGLPQTSTYAPALIAAFSAAPLAFQQQLCNLSGIYIVPACPANGTTCTNYNNSWGWRHRKGNLPQSYIGISAGFWSSQPTYSTYETTLVQTVLGTSLPVYSGAAFCASSGTCTSVDTFTTALLAIMAHEVGHTLWYVLVDPKYPDTNQLALSCQDGRDFFSGSWQGNLSHPPREWRHLSIRGSRGTNDSHKLSPQMSDIDAPDGPTLNTLEQLFAQDQPWASGFAAVSVDEDFVETYKFLVLTTANLLSVPNTPLNSVTLKIDDAPQTFNIPQDYFQNARTELVRKVSCIQQKLTTIFPRG